MLRSVGSPDTPPKPPPALVCVEHATFPVKLARPLLVGPTSALWDSADEPTPEDRERL